jgi:hypothetical protein
MGRSLFPKNRLSRLQPQSTGTANFTGGILQSLPLP